MFIVEYSVGCWKNARIEPRHDLSLDPAAVGIHYGQSIFEGLKAFRHENGRVALFRPDAHAHRLNGSAAILDMPELPPSLFVDACARLASIERMYVPPAPGSLYLRPTMFGTEPCLGVRSSSTYAFFILALPTGSYFKETSNGAGAISVLVSQSSVRAAPGGTGAAKTSGNYAATLKITSQAKRMGCAQVLFLSAIDRSGIEEMGGMNIFFVKNGQLFTPPLSDTILRGILRDSIITVAHDLGITVKETRLYPSPGPVTSRVYERIREVQSGLAPDTHGWLLYV
jgi:branched-chain amino acid aminotransferase